MALPVLSDAEFDALIRERLTPYLAEIARHQLNAISQGDELDAAVAADTAASTPATRARLRAAKTALAATATAIATLNDAARALDRLAAGTVNSAQRARNRANQAIAAGAALNVPDEPAPRPVTPVTP